MIRRIPWWVWLSANLVALPSWAAEASEPSEEKSLGYWGDQPARPFVSGEVAVGAMNVVEVAAGYGKPHFLWAGVKADGIVTTDFASTSAGLRLNGLLLNAYAGVRRTVAFSHRFPVVKEAYTKEDIKDDGQPRLLTRASMVFSREWSRLDRLWASGGLEACGCWMLLAGKPCSPSSSGTPPTSREPSSFTRRGGGDS